MIGTGKITLEYIHYCTKSEQSKQKRVRLRENWNFNRVNLSTFLRLTNPILDLLNFLSSRLLLSSKEVSYEKNLYTGTKIIVEMTV